MLILLAAATVSALADQPPTELRVATRSVPPFAFQAPDGAWRGIAIELWERVARDLGVTSRYTEVSLQQMLDGLADSEFDAAVGALSVTPERETRFDYSHPFYRTGLGVAVPLEDSSGWWAVLRGFVSPRFLATVGGLLALLTFVGFIVWLFERRRNAQFPRDPVRGIGAGLWWSSVTMTTVGYGDKAPQTFAGRFVGLVWMFVSIILISTITASLTTAYTLDALSGNVRSESDLARVRTGTVNDSTSQRRLQRNGIAFRGFEDLNDALTALAAGELDAVVYDKPLLRYRVRTGFNDSLHVLPIEFEPQDYAIGLPQASARREDVNRYLLLHGRGDEWEALLRRYLGEE